MNKDNKLKRHISILKTAIKKGLVCESHDWIKIEDYNIHVLEFEIEINNKKVVNNDK